VSGDFILFTLPTVAIFPNEAPQDDGDTSSQEMENPKGPVQKDSQSYRDAAGQSSDKADALWRWSFH